MSKRDLLLTTLVTGAALLFGCQDRPTAPVEPRDLGPLLAKGGKQEEPTQTVTFTFRDAEDLIFGDGRVTDAAGGTSYTNEECGVVAVLPSYNGNPSLNTKSSPIKRNDAEACGGKEGRVFNVDFRGNRADTGEPLDWDGQIVSAKWMDVYYELRTVDLGQTEPRKLKITFDDKGEHGGGGNGWGQACPWLLRFDSEWEGTSEVQVTRLKQQSLGDDYDEWKIEAAAPDDVAVCLGGKSEPIVLGYYHVPFQMNVVCRGEC